MPSSVFAASTSGTPPSVFTSPKARAVLAMSLNTTLPVVTAPCGAVYSIVMVLPTATIGRLTVPPCGF